MASFSRIIYLFCILTAACYFTSCKKDEVIPSTAPTYSDVPAITFVSVTPTSVSAYGQPLTFTISYQDGDGDLGENSSDAHNLYLTDNRFGITYPYRISELSPSSSVIIKGQLKIILQNAGITGTSPQSATFSI